MNRSGGDFEPERDFAAITFNRWSYGRNVSIANCDPGAMAYTHY